MRTPAEAGETYDYIVLANKATDPAAVPGRIAPAVDDKRTTIVIAQNGVGNEDPFREAFPNSPILSCVVGLRPIKYEICSDCFQGMGWRWSK